MSHIESNALIGHFVLALNGRPLTCSQTYLHIMFQDFQHIEKAAPQPVERGDGQNKETCVVPIREGHEQ